MLYLSASDVDMLAPPVREQTRLRYKNQNFVVGEVLPGNARKAAIAACRRYLDAGTFCLILSAAEHLGLCFVSSAVGSPAAAPAPPVRSDLSDEEFASRCILALAEHVGPIAEIVYEQVLAADPSLSQTGIATALAAYIREPEAAARFKRDCGIA